MQMTNSLPAEDNTEGGAPSLDKPTINILLYTDDPDANDGNGQFALGTMIAHLQEHRPRFADLSIKCLCRNGRDNADNRLDPAMLFDYDEVWFFGFHQANRKKPGLGNLQNAQNRELNEAEVLTLKSWMGSSDKAGGVLMTGDHNQEAPPDAVPGENRLCPDHSIGEKFLGLGRALGRCVPRAGRLRKWEGSPTRSPTDSFNTQVAVAGIDVDSLLLQIDPIPQHLVLRHFDSEGKQAPDGQPHPLFAYKNRRWIRVFPDHAHEGAVVLPAEAEYNDKEIWPEANGVQPRPQIAAYGIDERNCRLLNLIATYNGDAAGVGRIVADSTWHHYLNINLTSFGSPAPTESAADQIGQYYGNLALWLAPLSKRRRMALAMFHCLATHPLVREEMHNEVLSIGRAAYSILAEMAAPCEISELLQAVVPNKYHADYETLYFPESGLALSALPSKELIFGCVIDWYQKEMIRVESSASLEDVPFIPGEVVETGFNRAFAMQAEQVARISVAAQRFANLKMFAANETEG